MSVSPSMLARLSNPDSFLPAVEKPPRPRIKAREKAAIIVRLLLADNWLKNHELGAEDIRTEAYERAKASGLLYDLCKRKGYATRQSMLLSPWVLDFLLLLIGAIVLAGILAGELHLLITWMMLARFMRILKP